MCFYKVKKENIVNCEGQEYISYGISIMNEHESEIDYIPDVSYDREKVENLCELCNENRLSPKHIIDVVIDMIL